MKINVFCVVSLVTMLLLSMSTAAQVLDPGFTSPNGLYSPGAVYMLGPSQADGKRLVGGFFSRVNGTNVSRLVRLDAAGALDAAFSQNVGNATLVTKAKALPTGQYLLGSSGGNLTVGGLTRTELLRLNADGTADPVFNAGAGPAMGGYVRDFGVQPDGKVVAVGAFGAFSSAPAASVIRLTPAGGPDLGFSVGTGIGSAAGEVALTVLVQPDGKIMVGGRFATFNGQLSNGLVRLNTNGSVDPSFISPLNQAIARVEGLVLQPDGNVLVYGLLPVNSATRPTPGIVRLLPSGNLDPSFSAPTFLDAQVSTGGVYGPAVVLQPDGKILVSGFFSSPQANRLVRLTATGVVDPSFQVGAGPSSAPNTLGLQPNGGVLVGGFFNDYNGIETPLVQLSITGAPDPVFAPVLQSAGSVQAVAYQPNGQIVLGGNFTELSGQPVHRLARLTTTGALDAAYSAATGVLLAPVSCLALQPDGKLLAGTSRGTFRFAPSGAPDISFQAPYFTTNLALQADGRVLLGGLFNVFDAGVQHSRLLRLTATGTVDPTFVRSITGSWVPNTTDALLVQPDGRLVVGGTWLQTGQPPVARVVRYLATGALDATFNNVSAFTTGGVHTATNRVYALSLQPDGRILTGGNFSAVDGAPYYGVARLSDTGVPDPTFAPNNLLTGTVFTLGLQPNGRVLLGGSFTTAAPGGTLSGVARLLNDGQTDGSFGATTTPNGSINALVVQPDGNLLLAGSFTFVGGQPAVGVARIAVANVLRAGKAAALAGYLAAWPVPVRDWLHVVTDFSVHPIAVELLDNLGRSVRCVPANSNEVVLHVTGLPTGVYLLRLSCIDGIVTRRISIQ